MSPVLQLLSPSVVQSDCETASRPHPCHAIPLEVGFTLLEVMVALAILALGLVTVLELFAGSARLGVKASRHTKAAIYAQNEMNRLFAQPTLAEGEESGELPDGYFWRARVQEIHPGDVQTRGDPQQHNPTDRLHLYTLEVTISWHEHGRQQTFTLRSLRTTTEEDRGHVYGQLG